MEILFEELAKLLNTTVEKAIELYPFIKTQFIRYKILYKIDDLLTSIIIISAGLGLTTFLIGVVDPFVSDEVKVKCKKACKISIIILAISVLLVTLINILQYVLAPDFMMLKEFI